jgi:hypothetical protein
MSTLEAGTIEPQSGTTVTLGASGDAVVIGADALKVNTIKDAGANTILTSNGSGTLSSVNSALAGNMVFISSHTASDDASIEITSGIDSTYDEYVFYFVNINPGTNDKAFGFQVDIGSGFGVAITDTAFEAQHGEGGAGGALNYATWQDAAQSTGHIVLASALGSGSDESASGEFHLFAPSSTTYVKHFYATFQSYYENDYSRNAFTAGYVNTTSAVTGIKFYMESGNLNAGTIYLYGMK